MGRVRHTLTGLRRAIDSLDGFRGRKSVVMYSEGFILSPRLPDYQWIIDRCRRANIALFVADPQGLRTGMATAESSSGRVIADRTSSSTSIVGGPAYAVGGRPVRGDADGLQGWLIDAETAGATHVALATGGQAFFVNDATEAVARVLRESTAYYLIGFQPAEQGRPGERKLRVRVRREGLRVRARNRYYWGDPLPRGNDDSPAIVALRAMSDRADVLFRVSVTAGRAIGGGPVAARLRVEFEPAGRRVRQLKLLIEARPLQKGELVHDGADLTVPVSDVPLAVDRELSLAPGVWQARVVVTDGETGAIGTVLHTFEVLAEAGGSPAD